MESRSYLISFECKDCGWDWMGNFAYCPYCKGSSVKVVAYETMEEFAERMMLIRERYTEDAFFVLEEFEWDE